MNNKNKLQHFSQYILRTPLLPFSVIRDLTTNLIVDQSKLIDVCNNPIVGEAIFLASPVVYDEMQKWLKGELDDLRKIDKLRLTILKYLARMSTRCTPFGLFAGCSHGSIENKSEVLLGEPTNNARRTRLDMNFLVALSKNLERKPAVRDSILYFPNSSIYICGDKIRYVEYFYEGSERKHQIAEVDKSDYLTSLLNKAKQGAYLSELSKVLETKEIEKDAAVAFIEEIVNSQLLVSELEATVSGDDYLGRIITCLEKIESKSATAQILINIEKQLYIIDQCIGNNVDKYKKIISLIDQLEVDYNPKFLFQADLLINPQKNILDGGTVKELLEFLGFLNNITYRPKRTNLQNFTDQFYKRFETRDIPLSHALDNEIGIGYPVGAVNGDINPLIAGLHVQGSKSDMASIEWSSVDAQFKKIIENGLRDNIFSVSIDPKEFGHYRMEWHDLPDTISIMVELVTVDGEKLIKFTGGGGSSAANIFGRFSHLHPDLFNLIQEISDIEDQINDDKIVAEIVHLPESRMGNILQRPSLRQMEIPYLAMSQKDTMHQIAIDDILISLNSERKIILKSKSLNKEIVPRQSTAHNYSFNSLPIYHFLCDLQTQGLQPQLFFNLNRLNEELKFIPRIRYKNIILQEATWNLSSDDIRELTEAKKKGAINQVVLEKFTGDFKIPQYALLADGDNELFVNFANIDSVNMLVSIVEKRHSFKLLEFLHGEANVSTSAVSHHSNQFIIPFYNSSKLNR